MIYNSKNYKKNLDTVWQNYINALGSLTCPIPSYSPVDNQLNNYVMPDSVKQSIDMTCNISTFKDDIDPSTQKRPVILILGLNPSVVSSQFTPAQQFEQIYTPSPNRKGTHANGEVWDINYFQTIRKLIGYIFPKNDEAYAYADLFQMRVTKKNAVEWAVKNHTSYPGLTDFLNGQLGITTRLIRLINPDIIVVNNALASKYVLTGLNGLTNPLSGISTALNSKCGTYIWNNNGKDVPVFCTRMMSGGGLDDQSIERLAWHIRNVFRMNSNQLPSTFN